VAWLQIECCTVSVTVAAAYYEHFLVTLAAGGPGSIEEEAVLGSGRLQRCARFLIPAGKGCVTCLYIRVRV